MINFNDGEERLNKFLGSEKKTTILYDDIIYMLKYPDPIKSRKLKEALNYMNNHYSEYIGSSIFKACGIEAQEVALGYFTDSSGRNKVVVGCKDFTQNGGTLYEFSKLANQTVSDSKLGVSMENVSLIINECNLIKDKDSIINGFWDMFVVDALIGNGDRHFDNWGLLEKNGEIKPAPIYDCGSSLGAFLADSEMEKLMNTPVAFKAEEFNITSCYTMNEAKVFYHQIFKNPPDELSEAIKRIVPKIDMNVIHEIVESTPQVSEIRKEYLKQSLDMRYEQILVPSLKNIMKQENKSAV